MSLLIERVTTTLASLGHGQEGVNLFSGSLPSTPAAGCYGVISTGGYYLAGDPVLRPSFQIAYRTTHVSSGSTAVASLSDYIAEREFNALGCDFPGRLVRMGMPGSYYVDSNNHLVFTLNYVFVTPKKK